MIDSLNFPKTISEEANIIVLPFYKEKVDFQKIAALSGIETQPDFTGNFKETLIIYHPTLSRKIFLLGLGKKEDVAKGHDAFRSLAFRHHSKWENILAIELNHLSVEIAGQAMLGLGLAQYNIGFQKSETPTPSHFLSNKVNLEIIHGDSTAKTFAKEGLLTAETMKSMMQLVDSPANIKTPEFIGKYAINSAKENGFDVKVLNKKDLIEENLHTVLAVGRGSQHDPVLIQMEYKSPDVNPNTPMIGLVGKGITFDSGGVSIKGATNMHYMKSDMGGAAAVIGAIELAAKLKLPIHVIGIVPSAENSVDANSILPSDVIQSHSGKTIEIIDTDAEGRLILADGLSYIQKYFSPEIIIDIATLTGSAVRTFGTNAGALFSNDDELANVLLTSSQATFERLWRLPLWSDYENDIHSDVADIRNFSGRPVAGAITAAKFLEFFVKDHPKWAHLDVAGMSFGDSEYAKMKSAKGFGVRLLVEVMKHVSK
ncbi:MAG: M17 family metallopeptidase [Saprospiraceae bacterium]